MAAQLEGPPAPPEPHPAPPPPPAVPAPSPRFKIALYRNQLATSPVRIDATWDEFVDFLTSYVEESPCTVAPGPAKCIGKECPHKSYSSLPDNDMAWSPTEIVGDRLDANVRALTLLTLDFDHVSAAEAAGVVARLASYEHVLHTTHSHRVDDICFRAVLALSRPVHTNQWHRFLAAAIGFLGVTIVQAGADGKQHRQPDPTCKNRSRFYYRPSHPKDAPHDAKRVRGRVLDVDEVLAWAAANAPIEEARGEGQRVFPEVSDWDLGGEAVSEAIDVIVRYFPDRRRHELALALGGMLRAHGAAIEDARYIIREAFREGGSDRHEVRANTVDHTYALSEEAYMTGFTRVAEILGEDVARELGDHLTDACNDAFLRNVATAPSRASAAAVAASAAAFGAPPPPPAPVALGELRQEISGLATRRMRSHEYDDRVVSLLLRRVLDGETLARPGGQGDVETVLEGAERGIGRRAALERVMRALAFSLPPSTPWAAVREIVRASIASMEPA